MYTYTHTYIIYTHTHMQKYIYVCIYIYIYYIYNIHRAQGNLGPAALGTFAVLQHGAGGRRRHRLAGSQRQEKSRR